MSSADLHSLSDLLGIEPGKVEAVVAIVRLAVREEMDQARAEPRPLDHTPPPTRKYSYDEVRVRIHTGRDPASLSAVELATAREAAPSAKTIQRLVSRGHLERVKLSRTPYVTETQVRTYERRLAEGRFRQPAERRGAKRRDVS